MKKNWYLFAFVNGNNITYRGGTYAANANDAYATFCNRYPNADASNLVVLENGKAK